MTDQGAERMKKEWIYFIAGAGLAVAIMSATILIQGDNYSDFDECVVKEAQKYQSGAKESYRLIGNYCRRYKIND